MTDLWLRYRDWALAGCFRRYVLTAGLYPIALRMNRWEERRRESRLAELMEMQKRLDELRH